MLGEFDNSLSLTTSKHSSESLYTGSKKKLDITKPYALYIKRISIEKIFGSLEENLSTFLNAIICINPKSEDVNTPYNMFNWSKKDFMARRKMKNMYWLDIFNLELSKVCMEIRKLQIDIKELIKFTKLLHDDYKGLGINFATSLKEEQGGRNIKMNELELILSESDVYLPIQTRYQMNYYKLQVENFEDQKEIEQNAIRKQIENTEDQMRKELFCSQCTMNALYVETNRFRSRIEEMTARFTSENDNIDNKISYKRSNMEKMRTQRSYLEEQIHRFHEEIAHIHLMEIRQAERLQEAKEAKQRENEAKLLVKQEKKRKQKKKK